MLIYELFLQEDTYFLFCTHVSLKYQMLWAFTGRSGEIEEITVRGSHTLP